MSQCRVKWFNAKAGYGFATEVKTGKEVFVHHSELRVKKEQFRYLVEGEYVEVVIKETDGKLLGTEVQGIGGGKLMCETRAEARTDTRADTRTDSRLETRTERVKSVEQRRYKPKEAL
jgi:cold shock CspA family protein